MVGLGEFFQADGCLLVELASICQRVMGRMTLVEKPLPRAISRPICACSIPRGEESPLKVKKIEVIAKPTSSTKKDSAADDAGGIP